MLKILNEAQEIEVSTAKLLSFVQAGEKRGNRDIGFQGGYITVPTFYHAGANLWVAYERQERGHNGTSYAKHWFGYGLGDPNNIKRMGPICEINIPIGTSTAMIAGALAKDAFGGVFLVHTGKVGGGKPGVGQKAFMQYYSDAEAEAIYQGNSQPKRMVLIGRVSSPEIIELIADFVTTVQAFKRDVAAGIIAAVPGDSNIDGDNEAPEAAQEPTPPTSTGSRGLNDSDADDSENFTTWQRASATVDSEKLHARVRNTLTHILRDKGYWAQKDIHKDILIRSIQGELAVLFEVKSWCDTQSLYTAVGQLLVNSDKGTKNRILVIPRPGDIRIMEAAQAYGIETLFFEWEGKDKERPIFPELEALICRFPNNLQPTPKTEQ